MTNKQKILFITPRFPYPPLKGDQVIPYYRLRTLSKKCDITLLSFYESDEELAGVKQISQYCGAVYTVKLPKWRSLINMAFMSFFSKLPFQVLYYRSRTFQKKLFTLLSKNKFDLIHAYMLRMAPYIFSVDTPKILELIDSMQLNLERRICNERIPKIWLFKEELRRVSIYEQSIGEFFSQMIVVSAKDRAFITGDNVKVISLGVDIDFFAPKAKLQRKPAVIFSGNMGYAPNICAIKWFVENCFSKIQALVPEVSLVIAGGNTSKEILSMGNKPGIKVTGFVESMPDVLNQASVAIAPMQSGSGMQFKILEAMSCGLPVVTTAIGLGDIKAKPSYEICVADSAKDFINAVVSFLNDPEKSENIGIKAREFVIQNHGWEHIAFQIEEVYNKLLNSEDKGTVL